MTVTNVDIANRALLSVGIQKRINSLSQDSAEAAAANSLITLLRDDLLRMAPWNCSTNFANLTYITSSPGTPENTSAGTTIWQKGQPAPPWAYEYQYPTDCLRPLWIIPQLQTGFSGGIPITTAVTGGGPSFWNGPPVKFKVSIDQFYTVTAATPASGGTGYALNDYITLPGTTSAAVPVGSPVVLQVTGVAGGVITTVVPADPGTDAPAIVGGLYFSIPTNPVAQSSTTGAGVGATFNLTFGSKADQRVILTNQEFAMMAYVKQITDPSIMDTLFQDAWTAILSARLAMVLVGDKATANMKIAEANNYIVEARKTDANEGLTINDVTPDWIRTRGINYPNWEFSPNNMQYDWGPMWAPY